MDNNKILNSLQLMGFGLRKTYLDVTKWMFIDKPIFFKVLLGFFKSKGCTSCLEKPNIFTTSKVSSSKMH